MASNNGAYMSLQNSLTKVFSNCQLNYNCFLLTIGMNIVAVIRNSEQSFKIFDAHSSDLYEMPHSFGKCTLLTIEEIENPVSYLKISCLQIGVVPLKLKVSLSEIINLICKMFTRVQKLNICLSEIKETKHNIWKGRKSL